MIGKLKFVCKGIGGELVELDDADITKKVRSVTIKAEAGKLPEVVLSILAVPDPIVLPHTEINLELVVLRHLSDTVTINGYEYRRVDETAPY